MPSLRVQRSLPIVRSAEARRSAGGVRAEHVEKRFVLPHTQADTARGRILRPRERAEPVALRALHDVSFEVAPGEFVAITGRNGSGKSTLLRCMAGIYNVDGGEVEVSGRLAPFIELGVGFHADLTATDNLVTSGVMLGLSAGEVRRRVPEILQFAELEDFAEMKLRNLSSGMALRLAFSLTTQVDADVLVFDEVIAIGDTGFQERCFARFEELRAAGRTIVLVTHDMDSVRRLSDRALLLHHGELVEDGDPGDVADAYEKLNEAAVARPAVERLLPAPKPPLWPGLPRRDQWRRLWTVAVRLAVVEFKVKYLDAKLGYVWAVMRPLLLFGCLYVVFTTVTDFDAGVNNYALYLLTAIMLWTFFIDATSSGVFCLVHQANLLRKLPVPRAAAPLGVILRAAMDLGMNLVAVFAVALAVGVTPRLSWLEMPLLVGLLALVTAGVAFLCAGLYVRFRDTDQIWSVASQILFYGSPIIYTITVLPENAQAPVLILDPLAAIFTEMRHAFIDPSAPSAAAIAGGAGWLAATVGISLALLALGVWKFARLAPRAAEDL